MIVALLGQQEALLAELRWAYDQLERTQESDISELRSRVTRLEHRLTADRQTTAASPKSSAQASSESRAGRVLRRVESAVHDPERALRAATRRVRREVGRVGRVGRIGKVTRGTGRAR
ncbi:hypothetical protein GCM10027061_25840 [Nesterenkonia suensis]